MNPQTLWNSFARAVRFLTFFPLGKESSQEIDNRFFLISFPLVGFLIGLVLFLSEKLFAKLFPDLILSSLLLIAYLILTRMLHWDGLIDTLEGFLGGKNKVDILRIMKEPRVGSFGVAVAVCSLITFWAAVSFLVSVDRGQGGAAGALIVAPVLARWAMLFTATLSRPARAEGLGAWFLSLQSKENLLWASFLPLIVAVGIYRWFGLFLCLGSLLVGWFLKVWSERRLGGVTGDIFGAVVELSQLFVLVSAAAFHFKMGIAT